MPVSNRQYGNPDMLTTREYTVEEQLSEMRRQRGTKVVRVGDQLSLLDSSTTAMVEVINGTTRLLVSAEMAARFGLFPRQEDRR